MHVPVSAKQGFSHSGTEADGHDEPNVKRHDDQPIVESADVSSEAEKDSHEDVSQQTGEEHESAPSELVAPDKGDRVPVSPRGIRHGADDVGGQVGRRGGRGGPAYGRVDSRRI